MPSLSRRTFLGSSVAALGASRLFADDAPKATDTPKASESPKPAEAPAAPKDSTPGASLSNTLFLTWQRDPTTTMTVQWLGRKDETADNSITYRASGASILETWGTQAVTARPYPLSELALYRAELSGLKPGTDYNFRVGKQSPTYKFRTMPSKATSALHFISGGDVGSNSHSINNNIQAARQDPSFAVVGGDLAYDDGRSLAANLAFLQNYSKHMVTREGRLIPMLACLGNHEVQGGYDKPRSAAPFFYALFEGLFAEKGFATLDFGDYLSLVLLDTGHTTPIAGEQTDWLERTLKARRDLPHVIAVNHVPAYPSYRAMGTAGKPGTGDGNRQYWVPLFEKYRVPVVLEHHDHTFKRTKPLINGMANDNGVTYLGDGSWGKLRAPQPPEKLPILATTSGSYHLTLHRLEGDTRYHLALDEFGKVMDICRTGQRKLKLQVVPETAKMG